VSFEKWFANRGQIVQTSIQIIQLVVAVLALSVAVLGLLLALKVIDSKDLPVLFSRGSVLLQLFLACVWVGLVIFSIRGLRPRRVVPSPEQPTALSANDRKRAGRAGAIHSRAGHVEEVLLKKLEEVWYLYDQEKNAADSPLARPLSSTALPESISEWRHKKLWEFRTLYISHVNSVRATEPDFRSAIMDASFPSGITYLELKRNLEKHARALRDFADLLSAGQNTPV
jgi:hypothetical protein